MDPSHQWQQPGQGGPPQQPPAQQPQPEQYTVQQPYPPQFPQSPQPYAEQPYSAQPYSAQPYASQPYSAPPAPPSHQQPYQQAQQPYQQPYQQPGPAYVPAPLPPAKRNRFFAALVIAAVLLVVMAISVVVVALSRGGDDDPVAPPVAASSSYAGVVDPCLVGKWRQVSYQKNVDLSGTEVDKREGGIGKVKMTGGGKVWTFNADGSATEDDTATVYSGKDDKGRAIDAAFSGKAEWSVKTVGRTIEYAGKESTSKVVISVDGRKAGTIELEPNLEPSTYTCTGDVWRSSSPTDVDQFSRYDRVK